MKGVQGYELLRGIALKNQVFLYIVDRLHEPSTMFLPMPVYVLCFLNVPDFFNTILTLLKALTWLSSFTLRLVM